MAKIYCLYDTVAEESGPLFEAKTDAMAKRIFDNIKEFPEGATREDFRLFKLGSYFHGNFKERPGLFSLSQAIDLTRMAESALDDNPTEEVKDESKAV